MLTRVVIVLLVVLNLGVGAWWALRPVPRIEPVGSSLPGIALLQIVDGDVTRPATAVAPDTPALAAVPAPVVPLDTPAAAPPMQCASLGPFATPVLAGAAQARIAAPGVRIAVRLAPASGRGWRVLIAPLGDAAQATAMATRIGAAGITDYFVMRDGVDANAIALGRYGNETAARRRAQMLVEAGFEARAEPVGAATHWLDVTADAGMSIADLRQRSGAARVQPLDCAALPMAAG